MRRLSPAQRIALLLLAVALTTVGAVAAWRLTGPGGGAGGLLGPDVVRAPDGVRIKVEVLNATGVRGLARRATMHLRDLGFDVVDVGTSSERLDSTLVLDRSGHPEWAGLVREAMGDGRVESRPDTSRYLDVTVLIGASWRPPAEPFYP